jgi:hypothetical protein
VNKQILISNVTSKLNKIGIKYSLGEETDVSINCEFVNNVWKIGREEISYSALVYFDEKVQTVFMWEMIKENSYGFSFGCDSESCFQSGTTVFRKVKRVQYDIDGKACEYTFDLGEITKTFKETAKENGWKFKTVLRKKKALYPTGHISQEKN